MLMSLDDVAATLNTGRGRAEKWLENHGVAPALHLGRGPGGGPRWSPEDVMNAIDRASKKPTRYKKDPDADFFAKPYSQVKSELTHKPTRQ